MKLRLHFLKRSQGPNHGHPLWITPSQLRSLPIDSNNAQPARITHAHSEILSPITHPSRPKHCCIDLLRVRVIVEFHQFRFIYHWLISIHDHFCKFLPIENRHIDDVEFELCLLLRRSELAVLHEYPSRII